LFVKERTCEYCRKLWATPTTTQVGKRKLSLCNACYQYARKHGKLRPQSSRQNVGRKPNKPDNLPYSGKNKKITDAGGAKKKKAGNTNTTSPPTSNLKKKPLTPNTVKRQTRKSSSSAINTENRRFTRSSAKKMNENLPPSSIRTRKAAAIRSSSAKKLNENLPPPIRRKAVTRSRSNKNLLPPSIKTRKASAAATRSSVKKLNENSPSDVEKRKETTSAPMAKKTNAERMKKQKKKKNIGQNQVDPENVKELKENKTDLFDDNKPEKKG
jgi:hypothetical protein